MLIAVVVMAGTGFAARNQPDREALDALGRVLLLLAAAPLLFRHRWPVPVVFTVAAVTLGYLAAGYPYGPVFGMIAVACFAAVVHGHRTAAAWALGLLWAGHLLLSHWLYRWLPPAGDGPAPGGRSSRRPPSPSPYWPRPRRSGCGVSSGPSCAPTGLPPSGAGPTRSGSVSPVNSTTCSPTRSP